MKIKNQQIVFKQKQTIAFFKAFVKCDMSKKIYFIIDERGEKLVKSSHRKNQRAQNSHFNKAEKWGHYILQNNL